MLFYRIDKQPYKSEVDLLMESQNSMQPGSNEYVQMESLIAEKVIERNKKSILNQLENISDSACNFSRVKMRKIRQKVCPKFENSVPTAKNEWKWRFGFKQIRIKVFICFYI